MTVAIVVLPLLALLILFGAEIVTFAQQPWGGAFGAGGVPMQ